MRPLSFVLPLALATSGYAQSVADLPVCSLQCFASAIDLTTCNPTDYVCQCTGDSGSTIKQSVTACLAKSACSLSDLQRIRKWGEGFCPSVLSSAKATEPTSATSSPTEAVITVTPSLSSTSLSASATSSANAAASLGVGTPGTQWGKIKQTSKANRGPALEGVSIILLSIAAMILAVRFFARVYTRRERQAIKGLWWDDWLALAALIFTAGITADIVVGTKYGIGQHLPADTSNDDLVAIIKIVFAFVVITTAAFGALKVSILLVYLRMTPEKHHKVAIFVVIFFVIAHNIPAQIVAIFSCRPVDEYWNLSYPIFQNPHCIDVLWFDNFNNAWSVLEDIVIWAFPIPTIAALQIPLSRKAPLYGLVAVSFISVICSILRMAFVINWMRSADISWNYPLIPFFSNMEACIALITSSAPALLPFFRSFRSTTPKRSVKFAPQPDVEKASSAPSSSSAPSDPEKSFASQDSTAVATNRDSRTWSLLSKARLSTAMSKRASWWKEPNENMTTIKSETGATTGLRTELKDINASEEDIVPGLAKETTPHVK